MRSGGSRAMLPDSLSKSDGHVGPTKPVWVSKIGIRGSKAVLGPDDIDDSLRCEMSSICEGVNVCKPGA